VSVEEQLLRRVELLNQRAGFKAWDDERVIEDPVGDPGLAYPRLTPVSPASPRLFISYAWARDEEQVDDYEFDLWVDAFAGHLFNSGYAIVFDRDPRNFGKGLTAPAIVTRMNDCNYFVAVITEPYARRVSDPESTGAGPMEWRHALGGYGTFFRFIGIWHSGSVLPDPLTAADTVDIRADPLPWADPIREMFPPAPPGARAVPRLAPPDRPPDPPGWPAYIPYA
jgi:hypothetical protein